LQHQQSREHDSTDIADFDIQILSSEITLKGD